MLSNVAEQFKGLVDPHWTDEMMDWGERVSMYREYVRGEHRVYLTQTMRKMLNVTGQKFETFSADYTDMVVRMMSERLIVERIEATIPDPERPPSQSPADGSAPPSPVMQDEDMAQEAAQEWVDGLLKKNRFDALQMDVHESGVRDGDCFVVVEFDEARQCARFNFNQAYDGDVGVIPVYSRSDPTQMIAAVKIFYISAEAKQANFYYPHQVVKYRMDKDGGNLTLLEQAAWQPKVLPVVHFSNRRRSGESVGVSELQKVISLQDILNRTLVSMVMTSEMSAFPVLFVKGFKPSAVVAPGDVLYYNESDTTKLQYADAKKIEGSSLSGFIEVIVKVIDLIAEVTQTPIASVLGTNPSGEALKQREAGLLTKIRGAHVKMGNSWEDVLMVAHAVETTFKAQNKPPKIESFDTKWKDASVRSDSDVIQQAGMVYDKLGIDELYVEMVSDVTGWDEPKRQKILDMKTAQTASAFSNLGFNPLSEFSVLPNGVGEVA